MQTLEQEHLALIKSLLAAFATGDWTAVRGLMTEDVRFHFPGDNAFSGEYRGQAAAIELLAKVHAWTGGTQRVKLHDVVANEQHGVLMYTVTAKRGDKAVRYQYFDVYHFRDGHVSEVWGTPTDQRAFDDFYSE